MEFGFRLLILAAVFMFTNAVDVPLSTMTTAERIASFNLPTETYTVNTDDGYILTMFRIPNQGRPVVFLMHGLISSSDCWILNGRFNSLAFMLVDAGYDVWLGNARGNTYGRNHKTLKPEMPEFWNFNWHEIAIYDMPAMWKIVLTITGQSSFHYVGHSQGTTVVLVALSLSSTLNSIIKTIHLLAPVAFMSHMTTPLATLTAPILGNPSALSELLGRGEYKPNNVLVAALATALCQLTPFAPEVCGNLLFLTVGYDSDNFNNTLLPLVSQTHPAGSSTQQNVHYVQEYKSGYFRQFDLGTAQNLIKYGQSTPPEYNVTNIKPAIWLYYGDKDEFCSPIDVKRLEPLLKNRIQSYFYPGYTHTHFLWALDVKDVINQRIITICNNFEQTGQLQS